jgi:hypothetical protein
VWAECFIGFLNGERDGRRVDSVNGSGIVCIFGRVEMHGKMFQDMEYAVDSVCGRER